MVTKRQKEAIRFIENELNITFKGNINTFNEVSDFIGAYLEDAKEAREDREYLYYEALEGFDCDKYFM